jgi:hypothetical protein
MDELLRAAGRSITLRRTVQRWVEYALAMWIVAIAVLSLSRWQGWNLTTVVISLILLGCAFAAIAIVHNLRFIDSARREKVLAREQNEPVKRRSDADLNQS